MSDTVDVSVVVPVFRCAPCLPQLHARLVAALASVADHELVLVDDRSDDGAWEVIRELAAEDERVRGVRLSRNFGQHAAITAGLAQARGRRVIVLDCDLQDPPEEIPRLLAEADRGYDIVYARRKQRRHSLFRRLAARAYFGLMRTFVRTNLDGEFGSFSVIDRKVVDAFLELRDQSRHYVLVLHWLGFRSSAIDVQHAPRAAGKSSYSFRALVRHALDGVFFQTTILLRWIVYLGFLVALGGVVLAAVLVGVYVFADPYPGWTSLAVLLLLVGGFVLMSTGVTGLYIGKIFDQVRGRPLYVIDETVGGAGS